MKPAVPSRSLAGSGVKYAGMFQIIVVEELTFLHGSPMPWPKCQSDVLITGTSPAPFGSGTNGQHLIISSVSEIWRRHS